MEPWFVVGDDSYEVNKGPGELLHSTFQASFGLIDKDMVTFIHIFKFGVTQLVCSTITNAQLHFHG